MKKIVIIDTTWPINSRTERFKNSFKKYFHVVVVAWNRGFSAYESKCESEYVLNTNIGYGNQVKKFLKLPGFFVHAYKVCRSEKPDIIFASHWDSLICAVLLKIIWSWRVKIIYDCLDLPTFSNIFFRNIIVFFERLCLKFVSLTIFASRYFKTLYSPNLKSYIFENYPSFELLGVKSNIPIWINDKDKKIPHNKKNVAWIGVVRYLHIIENILLAIKGTDIVFLVFGDGPDLNGLKKLVKFHNLNDQVMFFGRYNSSDLRYIYEKSDLVWAAYPTNDYNAIYAISNKYFECSFFEKNIILSEKTKMACDLNTNPNVILVDEYSSEDIKNKILSNINDLKGKYVKYEIDSSWEENEDAFINFMKKNL